MSVDIEYNGSSIATIGAGQRATLSCRGKLMEGDVVISSPESDSCEVTYKGNKIADVPMGARVTIHTKGKQMEDDIVIEVVNSIPALDSPTISLEGDILTITDESGLAEEFDILVDGEVKATVEAVVEPEGSEGLAYKLSDDGTYYICSGIGTCTDTDIVIASEYEGLPVSEIANTAFADILSITSVVIPSSIERIGFPNFMWCSNLTNISVSESNSKYKSIDGNIYSKDGKILFKYAIGKTDVSFNVPDNVITIYNSAFANCNNLKTLKTGNIVTKFEWGAVRNCTELNTVTISNTVEEFAQEVFAYCKKLVSVNYTGTISEWNAFTKALNWNGGGVPATYVQCTDGTVAI